MTAADLIRGEVDRRGAIPFERFMELALYAPGLGYYTRERDPFGKDGDFYTAEQMQPVFGLLIARMIEPLLKGLGARTVVELGAGRQEMREAFNGFDYVPVDARGGLLPESFEGVVFANEFFDALPVHMVRRRRGQWRELRVSREGEGFAFAKRTQPVSPELAAYLARYHGEAPEGSTVEVNLRMKQEVARVSRAIRRGWWIIIDYGYTAAEWIRHTQGTLLAYHRHQATEAVLEAPGDRDLTAHVAWTPLRDSLEKHGWRIVSFGTMARALLEAGEGDQFASLFEGCDEKESMRRRMQLKHLLFGMGETFRVLAAQKTGSEDLHNENGPDYSGPVEAKV